ncbi:MAG: hypothetical protein NTY09_04670 [bacterium]|nr:hypothetical protein [bacterium]
MQTALLKNYDWTNPINSKYYLGTVFIILFASAITNFLVNPFKLYSTNLIEPIASTRYEKKLMLFQNYIPRPNALIVGSSRVDLFDPEIVEEMTGKRCFVWGVPDARAEVMYAIVRIAIEEFNAPIELLIIGVEPEAFHPTVPVNPQAKVLEEYTKYFSNDPLLMRWIEKFERLISFEQTRISFYTLGLLVTGKEIKPLEDFRPDGLFSYTGPVPAGKERRIDLAVGSYADQKWFMGGFDHLSKTREHYFEMILDICRERNIQVYAVSTPLQPRVYQRLLELGAGRIYDEASDYFNSVLNGTTERFFDYTDVNSYGGSPDYFMDGYHMDKNNSNILLRHMLADYRPFSEREN